LTAPGSTGDGYAAEALAQWEKTMAAMAAAVPSPVEDEGAHTASWWKCRLCDGCPDDAACTCMLSDLALDHAERVWQARDQEDEAWALTLENLRGLGCGRLYFLRERMSDLRREEKQQRKDTRRLIHQRDMLVTHLTAMSGAARRFAQLSTGESWWEEMSARQLRRALAETAFPATLLYARRVQGHARVCFELHRVLEAEAQAEELCSMTIRTLCTPMEVAQAEGDRVILAEQPMWQVQQGAVSSGVDGSDVCGDTVLCAALQDGRYLAALSDGMGHGEQARRESHQTAELLRLCLEAGYTRQQTLTAVNGMMLLCGRGERFSTVDMVVCDLWTGQVSVDKLGAASSWLIRGREMTEVTCDALPLGILEQVEVSGQTLRLREGDQLFLMTDGVEDAFDSRDRLRDALLRAADEPDAASAAGSLMRSAAAGEGAGSHDDRTAAVLRFSRTAPVQNAREGV
ncbi:MAG: SpoIIE family protein phosphatase, partial [Aristaeellaceae bacterium]